MKKDEVSYKTKNALQNKIQSIIEKNINAYSNPTSLATRAPPKASISQAP